MTVSLRSVKSRALGKIVRSVRDTANKSLVRQHLRIAGLGQAMHLNSFTTDPELRALLNLALECPANSNALEIGSHLGKASCFLAAGLARRGGKLFCVDTWQNETMPDGIQDTFEEFNRNVAPASNIIRCIRKRSDALIASDLQMPLHLVFIDGDHTYEAVRGDFQKVESWVDPTGIVAFHDCRCFEGVSRVIGEALAIGEWQVAGHEDNLLWIRRASWYQACNRR
jgi:predicted O-methyltransferase YrrM